MSSSIKTGKYQHYKGKMYQILGICHMAGSAQELVLYQALYNDPEFGENALWVRPIEEFLSKVTVNGQEMERFRFVG